MPCPSQESLSKRQVNTSTSKGLLFFAPKLREPRLERYRQGRGQRPRRPCPRPSYAAIAAPVAPAHVHRTLCVSTLLARCGALRVDVEGVQRLAPGHEQPIALG